MLRVGPSRIGPFRRDIDYNPEGILRIPQSHVLRLENVRRWRWSLNELALFDNRISKHYAIENLRSSSSEAQARKRCQRRTGERPYSIKCDASHFTHA